MKILGALLLTAVAGTSSFAQRVTPVGATPADERQIVEIQPPRQPISTGRGIVGGILGGAVGLVVGGPSAGVGGPKCGDISCSFLWGAVVGESIGLALGTHYGSRGNGNRAKSMLATTGIGLVALTALFASGSDGTALTILSVTPVVQLAVALALER